jgi:hypothetical protein
MLTRAAVLVQPLLFSQPVGSSTSGGGSGGAQAAAAAAAAAQQQQQQQQPEVDFADVALPIDGEVSAAATAAAAAGGSEASGGGGTVRVRAVHRRTGQHQDLDLPSCIIVALNQLGLDKAVGYLRVVRVDAAGAGAGQRQSEGGAIGATLAAAAAAVSERLGGGADGGGEDSVAAAPPSRPRWLPLAVQLGVPLHNLQLCRDVCAAAVAADFLSPTARAQHVVASQLLQAQLWHLIVQYGAVEDDGWGESGQEGGLARLTGGLSELTAYTELPAGNLFFDGTNLQAVDLSESEQAVAGFFAG